MGNKSSRSSSIYSKDDSELDRKSSKRSKKKNRCQSATTDPIRPRANTDSSLPEHKPNGINRPNNLEGFNQNANGSTMTPGGLATTPGSTGKRELEIKVFRSASTAIQPPIATLDDDKLSRVILPEPELDLRVYRKSRSRLDSNISDKNKFNRSLPRSRSAGFRKSTDTLLSSSEANHPYHSTLSRDGPNSNGLYPPFDSPTDSRCSERHDLSYPVGESTLKMKFAYFESSFVASFATIFSELPESIQQSAIAVAMRLTDIVSTETINVVSLWQFLRGGCEIEEAEIIIPRDLIGQLISVKRILETEMDEGLCQKTAHDVLIRIATDSAAELTRIFEYQIKMLMEDKALDLFAQIAAERAVHYICTNNRFIERNSIVEGVLYAPASIEPSPLSVSILYAPDRELRWDLCDVFVKCGLRMAKPGMSGIYSERHLRTAWCFYASNMTLPLVYGYRGVFVIRDLVSGMLTLSPDELKKFNEEAAWIPEDPHRKYFPVLRVEDGVQMPPASQVISQHPIYETISSASHSHSRLYQKNTRNGALINGLSAVNCSNSRNGSSISKSMESIDEDSVLPSPRSYKQNSVGTSSVCRDSNLHESGLSDLRDSNIYGRDSIFNTYRDSTDAMAYYRESANHNVFRDSLSAYNKESLTQIPDILTHNGDGKNGIKENYSNNSYKNNHPINYISNGTKLDNINRQTVNGGNYQIKDNISLINGNLPYGYGNDPNQSLQYGYAIHGNVNGNLPYINVEKSNSIYSNGNVSNNILRHEDYEILRMKPPMHQQVNGANNIGKVNQQISNDKIQRSISYQNESISPVSSNGSALTSNIQYRQTAGTIPAISVQNDDRNIQINNLYEQVNGAISKLNTNLSNMNLNPNCNMNRNSPISYNSSNENVQNVFDMIYSKPIVRSTGNGVRASCTNIQAGSLTNNSSHAENNAFRSSNQIRVNNEPFNRQINGGKRASFAGLPSEGISSTAPRFTMETINNQQQIPRFTTDTSGNDKLLPKGAKKIPPKPPVRSISTSNQKNNEQTQLPNCENKIISPDYLDFNVFLKMVKTGEGVTINIKNVEGVDKINNNVDFKNFVESETLRKSDIQEQVVDVV